MISEGRVTNAGCSDNAVVRKETAKIGAVTLMFDNPETESEWNSDNLQRNITLTTRYLFFASLFQGIFYWSDWLENTGDDITLFRLACTRLILGLLTLFGCFLVSIGVVIPAQKVIFWMNIYYGVPTVVLYFLSRKTCSHWDSLFVIYGLCYCMLPKISPLSFIYAISFAAIYCSLFMYLSSFRLSLSHWFLSNIFLTTIVTLFCYMSHSYERICREKWLMRKVLRQERIHLRLVLSSIEEDMNTHSTGSTVDMLTSFLNPLPKDNVAPAADLRSLHSQRTTVVEESNGAESSSAKTDKERIIPMFKGLGSWALIIIMGYIFDAAITSFPMSPVQPTNNIAFVGLVHCMGFSVFLMHYTRQLRWMVLNGVLFLSFAWVCSTVFEMDHKWLVFSTHSVGYILLLVVVVIMILVFGGVVLVWAQLIEFLKDILSRYPEMKNNLEGNKVFEEVIVRYISEIPTTKATILPPPTYSDPPVCTDTSDANLADIKRLSSSTNKSSVKKKHVDVDVKALPKSSKKQKKLKQQVLNPAEICPASAEGVLTESEIMPDSLDSMVRDAMYCLPHGDECDNSEDTEQLARRRRLSMLISSRKANTCYFCLKPDPEYLIPACSGWKNESVASSNGGGITMCTPYTTLLLERDMLSDLSRRSTKTVQTLEARCSKLQCRNKELQCSFEECQSKYQELQCEFDKAVLDVGREKMELRKEFDRAQKESDRLKEIQVQNVLKQQNAQLSELKHMYREVLGKKNKENAEPVTAPVVDIVEAVVAKGDSVNPCLTNLSNTSSSNSCKKKRNSSIADVSVSSAVTNTMKPGTVVHSKVFKPSQLSVADHDTPTSPPNATATPDPTGSTGVQASVATSSTEWPQVDMAPVDIETSGNTFERFWETSLEEIQKLLKLQQQLSVVNCSEVSSPQGGLSHSSLSDSLQDINGVTLSRPMQVKYSKEMFAPSDMDVGVDTANTTTSSRMKYAANF